MERRRWWTQEGSQIIILRKAAKAVAVERFLRCVCGWKSNLVKYSACVANEIDADSAGVFGFDQSPVLLKHLDDLDPKVLTPDWQKLGHVVLYGIAQKR